MVVGDLVSLLFVVVVVGVVMTGCWCLVLGVVCRVLVVGLRCVMVSGVMVPSLVFVSVCVYCCGSVWYLLLFLTLWLLIGGD